MRAIARGTCEIQRSLEVDSVSLLKLGLLHKNGHMCLRPGQMADRIGKQNPGKKYQGCISVPTEKLRHLLQLNFIHLWREFKILPEFKLI